MRAPILALAGLAFAMSVHADGPEPSRPRMHLHPQGGDWILKGGHKNPAGEWCCGEGDCFPMAPVRTTPNGYLIMSTGETVPYSEAQPSPDGAFWRCKRPDGSRRCFFAPPPNT